MVVVLAKVRLRGARLIHLQRLGLLGHCAPALGLPAGTLGYTQALEEGVLVLYFNLALKFCNESPEGLEALSFLTYNFEELAAVAYESPLGDRS